MSISIFSQRFNETLKNQGLSQTAFANKLGINQVNVNRWCTGAREPDFATLIIICKALNESSDYLLGLTDY